MNVRTLLCALFVKRVLIRASQVVTHDDANLILDSYLPGERLCGVEKLFITPVNCFISSA